MKSTRNFEWLIVSEHENNCIKIRQILSDAKLSFKDCFVGSFETFSKVIHEKDPRLIILNGFTEALSPEVVHQYLKDFNLNIPVLLIVNSLQEDRALQYFPGIIDEYVIDTQYKRIPAVIKALIAEAAKKSTEPDFNNIIAQVPLGIFQTDTKGACIFVNPYLCKLAGISEQGAKKNGWTEAIHPGDKKVVIKEWARCLQNNSTFNEEFRFLLPNGIVNWVSSIAIPLKGSHNEIVGFLGTVADRNEHKQFEEALIESQSRLEAVQELAKAGDWDYDLDKQTMFWSKEMYPIHERDLIQGPPTYEEFLSMVHPEDRKKVTGFQMKVVDEGHAIGEDYRIILKDGNIRHVYPTAYCMYDSEGKPKKISGTLIDVTDRIKTHESIKRNELFIDTLFSQSIDAMFCLKFDVPMVWNENGNKEEWLEVAFHKSRFARVNDFFLQMHGCRSNEIIGTTPDQYSKSKKVEKNRKFWIDLFESGRARNEVLSRKFDGSPLWIKGDYICIYDDQQRLTGLVGFQKDITNEKTISEKLNFSDRNFHEIFENSPDAIYIEDYNGVILHINAEACKMQNLPFEKLIEKNIIDITPESHREHVRNNFRKFCDDTINRLESFTWDKDWNPIPVEIKISRIVYSGTPAILLHVRDMRIKKITEGTQKSSIEGTLAGLKTGTWEWNVFTGEYITSGIEDGLLGYQKNSIKPTLSSWLELVHSADYNRFMTPLADHIEGRSNGIETRFRLKTSSGKYKWITCKGKIIESEKATGPLRVSGIQMVSDKDVYSENASS